MTMDVEKKSIQDRFQHLLSLIGSRRFLEKTGREFPTDPWDQLQGSVFAVFESWNNDRAKVYRLLKQARAEQVVQIIVHWPIKRNSGLERKLVDTFSLQEALVVRSMPETNSTTLRRVAQTGARYLERVLKEGMTLAVCIGRSTYEVIHAIRPGFQVGDTLVSRALAQLEIDLSIRLPVL